MGVWYFGSFDLKGVDTAWLGALGPSLSDRGKLWRFRTFKAIPGFGFREYRNRPQPTQSLKTETRVRRYTPPKSNLPRSWQPANGPWERLFAAVDLTKGRVPRLDPDVGQPPLLPKTAPAARQRRNARSPLHPPDANGCARRLSAGNRCRSRQVAHRWPPRQSRSVDNTLLRDAGPG